MTLDLTDDETVALAQLLRSTIEDSRYPLSPRLAPLRAILAKVDPPNLGSPLPPSKGWADQGIRRPPYVRFA